MSDDAKHGELSDAAIDWMVRLSSGKATAEDRLSFARWRGLSPEHEAAALQAEALMRDVGATRQADAMRLGARPVPAPPALRANGRPMRRRLLLGGAAAATVAAVAIGLDALGPMASLYADHSTRVGQRRKVELADGSTVMLNTATALSVDFTDERRQIVLYGGEAVFDVAKDPNRPFTVVSGDTRTRAVGTVFAVKHTGTCADVVVSEGTVEVRIGANPPIRLDAGQRIDVSGRRRPEAVAVDADQAMAWQRGKLIFNRRRLESVVAELERYRRGRIVILGEQAKDLRVTGVFELDDPDRLLLALQDATHVRISQLPLLTVIR